MLYPDVFNDNFFSLNFPAFYDFADTDRKSHVKRASNIMKTDVIETDDSYMLDIDLPGFKKEDINLELSNGNLMISATKISENEKAENGKVIRKERFSGTMQRSFYVGKVVTEEDVTAKFEDGVLKLSIPKKQPATPEKKTIMIQD